MMNLRLSLAIAVAAAGVTFWVTRGEHVEAAAVMAPRFEVDPFWPKPLPNHWVTGSTNIDKSDGARTRLG